MDEVLVARFVGIERGFWIGTGLALALLASSCISPARRPIPLERYEFEQAQMGLPFRIVLYASTPSAADAAAAAAFQRIQQLNGIMSDYDLDSELSRLSRTSGRGVKVHLSDDLWVVLKRSQELAERSQGAFDITVGPYANLWRKARREHRLPDPEHLAEAKKAVGYQNLKLAENDHTAQLLAPNMRLDLGGIAKGYAVDQALKVLTRLGISRALVAGGGDMAMSGPPPGRSGWRIELQSLDATNAPATLFLSLKYAAVATSGDLFQKLEIAGRRYSHIVDPHTGIGLTDHSLVNVIAGDCMTADSLTKVVSVIGPAKGIEFIEHTPRCAARMVRKPDRVVQVQESRRFRAFYDFGGAGTNATHDNRQVIQQ